MNAWIHPYSNFIRLAVLLYKTLTTKRVTVTCEVRHMITNCFVVTIIIKRIVHELITTITKVNQFKISGQIRSRSSWLCHCVLIVTLNNNNNNNNRSSQKRKMQFEKTMKVLKLLIAQKQLIAQKRLTTKHSSEQIECTLINILSIVITVIAGWSIFNLAN